MAKTLPLNARQKRFISEYMVDFNAAHAAARAGYSQNNSRQVGFKLMCHPRVRDEINSQCLRVQVRLEMNQDDVRQGFARIATDPRPEAEGGPSYVARIMALKELGKIFGMYTQKIQVSGTFTLVDLLLAADAKKPAPIALPQAANA